MEIPEEIDNYIKESIDHTLGLPVSTKTLQLKLLAYEESLQRVRNECISLLSKSKEKDEIIERARSEASMNAQAVKRFVEENQRLAEECKRLLSDCSKWERECSLYDHDREALMDFGNEADERAKEAEIRVQELEVELGKVLDELNFYKHRDETCGVDSSTEVTSTEETLLESILTLVSREEVMSGHAFLEANRGHEPCHSLLIMWSGLKPSTQKVISLAAEFKTLEKNKEHLRVNLDRAEEEARLLFEQNKTLDVENKRLLRQLQKERNRNGSSDGKQSSSASTKTNKRKSSPKLSSPIEKKIDFDLDSAARQPLSPLRYNSPDSRMHKK